MGIFNFLADKDTESVVEEVSINEKKDTDKCNALKAIMPELDVKYNDSDTSHTTLANIIIDLYSKDMEVAHEDIDVEDVADWVESFGGTGGVVLDFIDDDTFRKHPTYAVGGENNSEGGLCTIDPKFVQASKNYAQHIGLINRKGVGQDEKGRVAKLSDKQILTDVLNTMNRVALRDENGERLHVTMGSNATIDELDWNMLRGTLKEIKPFYLQLVESLNEEVEKIGVEEVVPKVENTSEEALPEEVVVAAHSDIINSLINGCWNLVSELNAAIATIEYDFKGDKESVVTLLNDVVDTTTINIGMLHKVSSLVDAETADLIATGEAKAEEKISE